MTKKIMATVLAASIALTSFTAPVMAKPNDGVRILQGLAALYIISRVVKDNKRPAPIPVVAPMLPERCLKTFYTPNGTRRAYGAYCLREYASQYSLPQECKRRIWTDRGRRNVYAPSCLRDHGYRITGR